MEKNTIVSLQNSLCYS